MPIPAWASCPAHALPMCTACYGSDLPARMQATAVLETRQGTAGQLLVVGANVRPPHTPLPVRNAEPIDRQAYAMLVEIVGECELADCRSISRRLCSYDSTDPATRLLRRVMAVLDADQVLEGELLAEARAMVERHRLPITS